MVIREEVILTEDQCKEAVARYQQLLCLEDWSIFLSYVPSDKCEVKAPDDYVTKGYASIDFFSKILTLVICNPTNEHRTENPIVPWDMEKTIVHELVHINVAQAMMNFYGSNELSKEHLVLLEQQVDAIANAIVGSKRGYYDTHFE